MNKRNWPAILATLLLLTACRSNGTDSFPVGEWYARGDKEGLFCRLNFLKNGRFEGFVDYQNKREANFEGSWQYKDNVLYYVYDKCEPVKLFEDNRDQDAIIEIADTYYLFKTKNGELHRYDRFVTGQPTPDRQPKNISK